MSGFIRYSGGNIETVVRTYAKDDVSVIFAGNVHIARREYFLSLQEILNNCEKILYERIKKCEPTKELKVYIDLFDFWDKHEPRAAWPSDLWFVHHVMDYSADNWVHWDVSWKEMWEEFRRRFPTQEDIERAKNIVLDRYERKGLGRLLNKREYAEYLIEWPYDEIGRALLEYRDRHIIEGIRKFLGTGVKRLGLFYGASHGKAIEDHLVQKEGFKIKEEVWLIAW